MPTISDDARPFPTYEAFEAACYNGKARALVRKIEEAVYLCEEPLRHLRLLQHMMRPVWTMPYRTHARDYEVLSRGLLEVLERTGARLLFHPPHEHPDEAARIALSWHSHGHKADRWHYKSAYLPHMLHFEQHGYSGWSELYALGRRRIDRVPQDRADAWFDEAAAEYRRSGASKYRQDRSIGIEGSGHVFVALQLPNDSVIQLRHFEGSYLGAMQRAVEALADAGERVVIKRHPLCDDAGVAAWLDGIPARHPGGAVSVSRASVHGLIEGARCVLTVNSGVGFEALMYLRPVVCLGKADYAHAGVELADPSDAAQAVRRAVDGLDAALIRRFVFLALNQFQLDTRRPEAFERQVLKVLCRYYLDHAAR